MPKSATKLQQKTELYKYNHNYCLLFTFIYTLMECGPNQCQILLIQQKGIRRYKTLTLTITLTGY